jgi:RHS repeat-associated protein
LPELNGRLKYIKDKYSNQITFDLSSSTGKITGITDCFGRYITFTYSTTAPYNLSQIQDFSGRQWQYIYTSGNLSIVRFPATPDCTSGLEYEYTYDDNHNLTDVHVEFNGYILCVVKNYYNTSNKVYQQIRYMGEIWEPRNNTSTVYYNTQTKTATVYNGEHHKKTITYNDAGMKTEETVYTDNTQENPNHFTTQYIYDSLNRLSRIIHPAGNCEEYTYNSEGFLEGIYKKTSASVLNNPSSPDVIATLYTYCSSSNPALYSKVETITDALGNVTEYEYFTDTGYLKKVTGPEITTPSGPRQASVEYTYTAAGMVDTITDPNGIVTKYVYYQTLDYNNGLLWKVIQDYGVGQQYLNLTTTYTYDELRRVLTVTNPKNAVMTYAYNAFNQVTQITSPSPFNYVTKYSYHFSGKPRKIERQTSDQANPWQVTEMTYNSLGQILTVKNALNKTTTYTYDQTERRSSVKDALNRETKYEYDERGLLVKVTDPNDDDTLYAYDLNGNRTSVTDSNGNATSYEYDSFDRITKITNAEGHYRSITYDKLGRKITEIAYDRKDINNLTDDIALMQTRYEYNAAGDLIRRAIMADASAADTTAIDTSIDNVVDYTFYWGNGPRAQEKKYYANGSNAITYKFYDRLNRLRLQVDPSLNSTQYVYDSTDNVLRIQKVDKNPISGGADLVQTTDFIYDELGRRIYQIEKPQNPDAQSDSSWQATQYVYDALNNRIQEIRPNGVIVLYGYDLLGRKISMVVDPIDANNPNGINQITEYGYDDVGRQITIAGYADNTNPATKQTTGYEYDSEDRVVQITYPDNATIQYAYTSIGNVWRRTDQRGIQTYYTYDDTYNMTQKTATIGSVTTTENFVYDGLGRMLIAQKLEGVNQVSLSEFEYNDNGKISDAWESIFNLQEKQIQYAYDNAGYLVQTIYPNTVQIDRTNDWQGRIDTLTKGTTTFIDYAYMGNKVAERKSGSYIYFRPEYDNLGRMTRAYTYRDITNITLADFSYTFADNENNIETMSIDHRPNQPYNTFSYDLDRITDVVYLSNQNDVESFPMDDLGNRTGSVTQRDGVHNYSVNTFTNRYTTIDSVSISYDAAGNLIQDKDGYHYVYDYENRVIRIFKLDGQTEVTVAQYAYDALGRRIWKNDPLATQPNVYYYYNDQWQILCEYTGTDSCLQWFTYGNYIDEVLSRNTSTTAMLVIQYYIQDHLYNVVGLANMGGTVVERYEYDVYGNPTIINRGTDQAWYTTDDITLTASAYNNLFNFTGRQLDVLDNGALKYMHYRHRDYSLSMGRFIHADPLGINLRAKNAVFKNLFYPPYQTYVNTNIYEYVKSNPVMKYDPSGFKEKYPHSEEECLLMQIDRLKDLGTKLKDCIGDAGYTFSQSTVVCVAGCAVVGAATGGDLQYRTCFLGCMAVAGVADMAIVNACYTENHLAVEQVNQAGEYCKCRSQGGSMSCCQQSAYGPNNPEDEEDGLPWWIRIFE